MKARMLGQKANRVQSSQPMGNIANAEGAEVLKKLGKDVMKQRTSFGPLLNFGGTESLDISVGKISADRAMWFMQQVITGCESAGIKVALSPKYPAATNAIDEKAIQIRIREKTIRSEKPPSSKER